MEAKLVSALIAALAAHYWAFVFQRKNGPFDCFLRLRRVVRKSMPPVVAYHVLCPTCTALSIGVLMFLLTFVSFDLVLLLAVPGLVMLVAGMSGHPHLPDFEEE